MKILSTFAIFAVLAGCSSTPKVSGEKVGQSEGDAWFKLYCSDTSAAHISGDLVLKSNTKEFKGQFPASTSFEKNGTFQLEVTNILGGTVAQLKGDSQAMQIIVPSRPKYNRSGVTHYLGLEMRVLLPLLRGELPCPAEARTHTAKVQVEGNAIKVRSSNWDWYFYRSTKEQGEVPAKVVLKSGGQTIEMNVEDWNAEDRYLKKGHVQSPEGELKWTWRSRTKE